jgi:alkylation response protein AidB-like acyl-CoA dehydrogenase
MADFTLDEDQKQIQNMMRKFAEDELRPMARDCDEEDKLLPDLVEKVWALGFCPNIIPEKYGGYDMGRSTLTAAIMAEELAWGDASLAIGALSPLLMAIPVLEFGTEEQKEALLPKFCGEKFYPATAALMEKRITFEPTFFTQRWICTRIQ